MPITSNVVGVSPFYVLSLSEDTRSRMDAKARGEQAPSVDVERVGPLVGRFRLRPMFAVKNVLPLHLEF